MQIVALEIDNLKRIRTVLIVPKGPLVQITGANGSGKSSVLDGIYWAIAGKKAIDAATPVRQGEETARVKLDLGEVVVTRKFSKDGTTSVTVEDAEGGRFNSPQTMLDQLFGGLTFDPLAFSRMTPAERSDVLRKLVKLDVDTAALDRANTTDFEARRNVNRQAAELAPRVKAAKDRLPSSIPELVDTAALTVELKNAGEQNVEIERQRHADRTEDEHLARDLADLEALDKRIAALQEQRRALVGTIDHRQARIAQRPECPEPVDTAELAAKLEAAHAHNRKVEDARRAAAEYSDLEQQLAQLEEQSNTLTAQMDERTTRKREAIAAATMPVEGLTFGDGFTVLYRGLPFEQASSAEQLRVSVAIAMAMNPRLRVLRIKDGSLLDENNLALIGQMAEAGGYQVWVERVDTSGRVGVVMEDGAVKQSTE